MIYERILTMICTKCGNEIPDGAKFCPSCGAVSQAAPEKKLYCEKCGLELMNGAKFCSVCGGTGVMRDAAQSGSTNAAVVDLNKPSQSDSLVSAMNGISAAAGSATGAPIPGVPMPSNDVPTPSNDVSAPSGSSPASSGYAPSNAMPVIPPFVASASANVQQAPIVTPVPAASGAAVSTKRGGKIALFAILGVLLIAIAAAAIMFSTNRATFLSTFMGKEKYATMVEGNSIKNATEKLDIPAIANGIKAASGTYQAMSTTMGNSANPFMSYSGIYSSAAPMSYGYGAASAIDPEFNAGFNVSELSKMLAEALQSYYGANSISETLTVNVQFSDSVKAMLGAGEVDVDKYLDLINGTSVNYTLSAKDDKTAIELGTNGQFTVNAQIMLDGQDVYIALPFASDKALMISVPASSESIKSEAKPLELDEKELERLITECVEIYLDHYKAASIEMENGEIKAADVTVNGKLIVAEFKGEQLSKLFSDIAEHIVKDDYLMTQIADYANSCGAEVTKQELIDEALDSISETFSEIEDSDKLVINTVIDNNGNVLGKTVKAMGGEDVYAVFSYAETADRLGFEMTDNNEEFSLKATVDKIDDKSGACNITVTDGEDEGSFILNYSNVAKTEFCGKEICTGDFSFGMKMPESFADQLGKDAWAAINGAKLNLGLKADSKNTLETNLAIEVPSYGSVSLKDVFTVSNDEPAFNKPANVINITDAMLGGMPDETTMAELEKYGEDLTNALKNAVPEFIKSDMEKFSAGSMIGGNDGPNVYPGSGSLNDDVADLLGDIQYDMDDIQKALNGELAYDTDYITSSELEALLSDYTNLYLEIIVKGNAITENELDAFYDRYWDLYMELPYFDYEDDDYFDDPRLNALSENIADSYITALSIESYYSEKLSNNPEATALYNDVENACSDLLNYFDSTGADDLDEYTEEQLNETERLLGILDAKIEAFMAKYRFT